MRFAQRPSPDEHASEFGRYIALVPDGSVVETLRRQIGETRALMGGLPEERAAYRYAPGKWSVTEVAGHLADAERVFAYRALWFARGDRTPLPGFDESAFAKHARYGSRPLEEVLAELESVRAASLALFGTFDAAELSRRGVANDAEISVRAIVWSIAGHELHHRAMLRERYLAPAAGA
jgi:uncharacterized membrane protein